MLQRRPRVRRPAPVLPSLLAGLVLALVLGGCSGADDPTEGPESDTPGVSGATDPPPVPTRTRIAHVEGRLAPDGRARLRLRVQEAVDSWIDGAYGGDYPRSDFATAFDAFTPRAATLARADAGVTSNADLGPRLETVRPVRRQVVLDVLAVDGRASAVTADVRVVLELGGLDGLDGPDGPDGPDGEVERTDAISGSLYLTYATTRDLAGWRVFGYDLARREI